MIKIKMFAGLALMVVILITISSTVMAAPVTNTISPEVTVTGPAPIVGSVQTITLKTDANNVTTVEVTLLDQNNMSQTVTFSLAEAVTLGLVTLDVNNVPSVNTAMIGQAITIQPPAPTPTAVPTQTTSIVGVVQTITLKTDTNNVTTVEVTLLDQNNIIQTVTLSLDEAVALGLVSLDANNVPTVITAMIGQSITVQQPAPVTETALNPVGSLIAAYFGLEPSVINGLHEEGSGYGVIVQACWMSYSLKGDASLCSAIVDAKKSGDYSTLGLPDGVTTTNWGQFKKAVSENRGKMRNLGAIMSGRADPLITSTPEVPPSPEPSSVLSSGNGNHGNGNGTNKIHGKDNNNGKGPHK